MNDPTTRSAIGPVPQPPAAAGSDIAWLRYRRVARFLSRLQKRCVCSILVGGSAGTGIRIAADERSMCAFDRQLGHLSAGRFLRGLAIGLVCGVAAAYVVIPTLSIYLFSSRAGILPPEYDALIRTKNANEQALQILEHAFEPRTRGSFGRKRVFFEARINDSSIIRLAYDSQRKGLVTRVGQRVGSRVAAEMVRDRLSRSGVDSVVGRVTGEESSVAEGVGDAVSRAASMQVDKKFRRNPVITVTTLVDGMETVFTNYYEFEGAFRKDFTVHDADTADMEQGDHTRAGRKKRFPTVEDQQRYLTLVKEFLSRYRAGEYSN